MQFFKDNKIYDLMSKKKFFGVFSLVLVTLSIVLLFTKGLNFGIDFKGGTIVQVKYEAKAPIQNIRGILDNTEYKGSEVTRFGSESEIIIKIKQSTTAIGEDLGDKISKILTPTGEYEIRRVDMVGPKVGNELKEKGLTALILSLLVILAYVSYRFEYRFAVASILALVHDVLITVGVLIVFQVDINLDILAAILTIIGYSLNDTIIVFDRVRESVENTKESDLNKLLNNSISKTLSRTTLTSLTTFFVVLTLFLFGGEIIHGFALTMLVGVIVGTYSSIFVASPILDRFNFDISNYRLNKDKKEQARKAKERERQMYENGRI